MPDQLASRRQIVRLMTLWGHWLKMSPDRARLSAADAREARLDWLGQQAGRTITSARELSRAEAARAIDTLAKELPPELVKRRPGREEARRVATAGRRVRGVRVSAGAAPPNREGIAKLERVLAALGWDQDRLEAFLRSRSSPLRGRTRIATLDDLNRVLWPLERIERRKKKSTADSRESTAEEVPAAR